MASLTLEDVKRALLNRSNVFVVALWISQACLSVSHKRVSIVMKESPFVLTILQPVWIAVAFGIVWAAMCFRSQEKEESSTDTEAELSESDTSSEEISKPTFRVWHSAVTGLLFTTYNFLGYSGARGHLVSGPLILLLQQTVIPLTMLFSVCFLGRRYFGTHFLSCAFIVAGILASFVGKEWTAKSIGAVCLLLAQAFPGALSTVFMEYNLQRSHVSFWKLWTLINIWEVVALPPVWVASVPLQGLTFAQSPKNLLDGFQCLFVGQGSVEGADDEECATLGYLYPIFVVALIAVKTLQAVVIAKFSSGLLWVVAAAAVPLASQAFTVVWIMGPSNVQPPLSAWIWLGTALVVAGMVLFRVKEAVK